MKASDFMTTNVFTCTENQTVEEAATLMTEKKIGVVPVVNDSGVLVGIITEGDFIGKNQNVPHAMATLRSLFGKSYRSTDVEQIYKESKNKKLSEVMTKNPKTLGPDDSLDKVVSFMSDKNFKRVPIVDEAGKVVGIITRSNVIKAFRDV